MGHGAVSEKEADAIRKDAERPIDKEPLYIQQHEKAERLQSEVTRLAARNLDLEKKNKLLEDEAGRFAAVALRGGVQIQNCSQILMNIPGLYDEELQEIALSIALEMKKREEKSTSKRKTERRKTISKAANGHARRSTSA